MLISFYHISSITEKPPTNRGFLHQLNRKEDHMNIWWAIQESNLWPRLRQRRALANWANRPDLVSREGLEPSTPGLKGPCSNLLSYRPKLLIVVAPLAKPGPRFLNASDSERPLAGGADWTWTSDTRLFRPLLYQLSYSASTCYYTTICRLLSIFFLDTPNSNHHRRVRPHRWYSQS